MFVFDTTTFSDPRGTFLDIKVSFLTIPLYFMFVGKKNSAIQKFFIGVSIENFIVNISLYALSWPKLNFGCNLTFKIIFLKVYFNGKINKFFLDCWVFNPR